jgi:hypothetical protein
MSDMMQTGLAWLTAKHAAYASATCVLTAGQTSLTVRVTLAKRQVEVSGEGGATMIAEIMTALIPAGDLLGAYRPKNGGPGAKAWDWSNAHKTAVRVYLREHNAELATG